MNGQVDEDELQDLSPADARELRAFLDKRRWFEEKLKLLEDLAPIYPFVHPTLSRPLPSSSPATPSYEANGSKWVLPTAGEIQKWQEERTALEGEILAFDDGDLARMKQKTKTATLFPLTPPSTHLVSITLALIVLVDRLMTLLRHRADLLELTSLRLQWDQMRWQIMLETNQVRLKIDAIARTKGRWVPPTATQSLHQVKTPSKGAMSGSRPDGTPLPHSSTLPSLSSISSALSDVANPITTPQKSPLTTRLARLDSASSLDSLANGTSPKRGLHLPLLHSSIVSLHIRRKNLSDTLVARSGKLLDRMIDLAIPLKQLGGTDGPIPEEQEGRAVPDKLLDIQDDLENELNDIEGRLVWCGELEEQWRRADEHYLASEQAREASENVLAQLRTASTRPASSEEHKRLRGLLDSALAVLPEKIDSSFPTPQHPSYPETEDHNAHLIRTLCKAHQSAEGSLPQSHGVLEWYSRLASAEEATRHHADVVRRHQESLTDILIVIERGDDECSRPALSDGSLTPCNMWLGSLPIGLEAARGALDKLGEANQRLAVEIMRHQRAVREIPESLRGIQGHSQESYRENWAEISDEASETISKAKQTIRDAELDAAVLSMLTSLRQCLEDVEIEAVRLRVTVDDPDEHKPSESIIDLGDQVSALQKRFEFEVDATLRRVQQTLDAQDRQNPKFRHSLDTICETPRNTLHKLQIDLDRVAAVTRRRELLGRIDAEAAAFLKQIDSVQAAVHSFVASSDANRTVPNDISSEIEALYQRVKSWTDGIPHRVSSNAQIDNGPDDRKRVNEIVARVHGALDYLRRTAASAARARNGEQDVFGAVLPVANDPTSLASATLENLKERLANLRLDEVLSPSPEVLESNHSYRQIPSSPVAKRIRSGLQAIGIAVEYLQKTSMGIPRSEFEDLAAALAAAEQGLPRLDELVTVSGAVQAADEACSRLLDALDSHPDGGGEEIIFQWDIAERAVKGLQHAAATVSDDVRVRQEVERVESAWTELHALAKDVLLPGSQTLHTVSETSSIGSTAFSAKHPVESGSTPRLASNPTNGANLRHTEPRDRSTSDTPSRNRVHSLSSGLPRLRTTSMGRTIVSIPTPPNPRPGHSLLPRPSRLSLSTSTTGLPKTNGGTTQAKQMSSRTSLVGSSSSTGSRREYVADPKSKLDMAVGQIVNHLRVDVPIKPVGMETGDDWKDQSGKYWIGAEGRARLCFCRILRSKMVMVRVGGGWVELSKFLMDHFADSLVGWNAAAGPAGIGIGIGPSTPVPITSATPTPRLTKIPIPTALTPTKQVRSPYATPHKTPHDTHPVPPESLSPLVPLHFIRRASESPPVRQWEREKLNTGRRSILGRSSSGNVRLDESPEKQ